MTPWRQLNRATVPGGVHLRLMQRGAEFSIMAGTSELMNSRVSGSEKLLATLPCQRLRGTAMPRLLIGGLGMGFTLRAALAELGPDAEITVAELIPAVVSWARGPLAPIFSGSLDDPRVTVIEGDVARLIVSERAAYDAILLDVDNGPGAITYAENERLYASGGLGAARAALRPGGILAVWSSAPDHAFTAKLVSAGFAVEVVKARANGARGGARHIIWLATKGAA